MWGVGGFFAGIAYGFKKGYAYGFFNGRESTRAELFDESQRFLRNLAAEGVFEQEGWGGDEEDLEFDEPTRPDGPLH